MCLWFPCTPGTKEDTKGVCMVPFIHRKGTECKPPIHSQGNELEVSNPDIAGYLQASSTPGNPQLFGLYSPSPSTVGKPRPTGRS